MNMTTVAAVGSAALIFAGRAQKAGQVTATYISPLAYQSYSCRQVTQEASRVSA